VAKEFDITGQDYFMQKGTPSISFKGVGSA
jgi:hypothetical protein